MAFLNFRSKFYPIIISLLTLIVSLIVIIVSYLILNKKIEELESSDFKRFEEKYMTEKLDISKLEEMILDSLKSKVSQFSGNIQAHQWRGTSIRFMNHDGSWGDFVNLKGEKGDRGERGTQGLPGQSITTEPSISSIKPFSFKSWQVKNINATYAAESDGIVIASINAKRNGRGTIIGKTENIQVSASVNWQEFSGNLTSLITDNSIILPVRNGKDWSVKELNWNGNVSASVFWLPLQ